MDEIAILYPGGVNWFYETLAQDLAAELRAEGLAARAVSGAKAAATVEEAVEPRLIVVNFAEVLLGLDVPAQQAVTRRCWRAKDRILFNYDSIHTHWFDRQFSQPGLFTAVIDLCMTRQTEDAQVKGLPYHWLPEALTRDRLAALPDPDDRGDRPLPWLLLGHVTPDRASFAAELMAMFGANGAVFLPPLRPFGGPGTLGGAQIARLLRRARLYPWRSHHAFPYHEGMRALHALSQGALPLKIDPLFADRFADLPWVFPSLEAARAALAEQGEAGLYARGVEVLRRRGPLGGPLAALLRGEEAA